ncbi:MAG: AAA family ATPase [Hyphomicrobium sp.]|nr:AAA family ATPase [Hyphomicrobium sp.]
MVDIDALDSKLDECGGSQYDIIVIDAFYRILPKGMSENDNASMTQIYNKLDGLASKNEASIINIHHSSKGNQGDKGVTDVGAGAGAISRAADTHMVIREHLEEKHVVIEAVTRSGLSPAPVTAEFQFPLWIHKPDMDPTVKSFENARSKMNSEKKDEVAGKYEQIAAWVAQYEEENGKQPNSVEMYEACKLGTWGKVITFKKHLKQMSADGILKELPKAAGSNALRYTSK